MNREGQTPVCPFLLSTNRSPESSAMLHDGCLSTEIVQREKKPRGDVKVWKYILKRVLLSVVILFFVAFFVE